MPALDEKTHAQIGAESADLREWVAADMTCWQMQHVERALTNSRLTVSPILPDSIHDDETAWASREGLQRRP